MTAICRKIKGTVCCLNENPDYLFSVKPAAANKMREANLGTPCGGNIENKKRCQNGFIISFSVKPAAANKMRVANLGTPTAYRQHRACSKGGYMQKNKSGSIAVLMKGMFFIFSQAPAAANKMREANLGSSMPRQQSHSHSTKEAKDLTSPKPQTRISFHQHTLSPRCAHQRRHHFSPSPPLHSKPHHQQIHPAPQRTSAHQNRK